MTVYVEKVRAMEIFDSRGNPTVEVHVTLSNGTSNVHPMWNLR